MRIFFDNKLSNRIICKIHKWMAYKMESFKILPYSVPELVSYIWFFESTGHFVFCRNVVIFMTVVSLARNHCNYLRKLWFSTLTVLILYPKFRLHYFAWLFQQKKKQKINKFGSMKLVFAYFVSQQRFTKRVIGKYFWK